MVRAFALTVLAPAFLLAQVQHPNYSGIWKLSPEESDFAGLKAPRSRTADIRQNGDSLTETVNDAGASPVTLHFEVGGAATSNTILDKPMQSTAKWDGQDLAIRETPATGGDGQAFTDHWTLSLDGGTLTIRTHFADQGIEHDQMLIFHKQTGEPESVK